MVATLPPMVPALGRRINPGIGRAADVHTLPAREKYTRSQTAEHGDLWSRLCLFALKIVRRAGMMLRRQADADMKTAMKEHQIQIQGQLSDEETTGGPNELD